MSEKTNNKIGNDKVHLNCYCVIEIIPNGVGEPILFVFPINKLPEHKIYKKT